ncbi:MAG: hypothetical protein AAF764_08580, partial [Pseudomonadota bacterium]
WLAGERARFVRAGRAMVCQGNGGETPSAAEPQVGRDGRPFSPEDYRHGSPFTPHRFPTDAKPEVHSAGGRFSVPAVQ